MSCPALSGYPAVVANSRKGVDTKLIGWGRSNNLITPIDRGTKWGNPFKVERHTRAEHERVVALYRNWLPTREELMTTLNELRGRILLCFCFPWPCHGDILAEMVNSIEIPGSDAILPAHPSV